MIRLLTAVFLFASFHAVADDLKTFSDGQVINADDFNHNFQKLERDIANGVTGPKGDTGDQGPAGADGVAAGLSCTTDQIIKWDGTNDVWVCATDPFAGLNCNVGDQLRLGSSGWECRAEPITARLTQDSWDASVEYGKISTYFDTYLNIDPDLYCNHANVPGAAACAIRVLGVSDHNSCIAEVYGGAAEGLNASVDISVDGGSSNLYVGTTWTWYSGEPVSIDIICAP